MLAANVTNSLTVSQMFEKLGTVLDTFFDPSVPVILSQQNGVSMPVGDFVMMTPITLEDKSTSITEYQNTSESHSNTQIWKVQIDCFGAGASTMSNTIKMMWRTAYVCDLFAKLGVAITPLYTDQSTQTAFKNDAANYEDRYTLMLYSQVRPIVTVPSV